MPTDRAQDTTRPHRNYEWHNPRNPRCGYSTSIGVASPDADWCSCPPPAADHAQDTEAIRAALEYRPLAYQDLRLKADAALARLVARLEAAGQVDAAARVVVEEWRAENPFVGYSVEALEAALAAAAPREIVAAFDELQDVREAAEKLVGVIYGLSVNSDADYDEALGSLRQALAGVSGAD